MQRSPRLAAGVLSFWSLIGTIAAADELVAHRVGSGLNLAVYVTAAPGDANRLFAVEQKTGNIRILELNTGQFAPEPFLHVNGVGTSANEQGLLGMAFHPEYEDNGRFYVNYTDTSGDTVISEYQVSADNPSLADPATARSIISYDQPFGNHNGGWLGFGPDGYLYIPTGDGGSGNDPGNRAQDITDQKLGKILRLDVDGDDFSRDSSRNYAIPPTNPFVGLEGDDEIWAYGLRNPWRVSFDRQTGDLYIGDVGQRNREEIDVQPASSTGGENYGWRLREGTIQTPNGNAGGAKPAGAIDPIYDYLRNGGPETGESVTGGYVYRGPMQQLDGKYFFTDYRSGNIWSLEYDGSDPSTFDGTNYTNFTTWTDIRTDAGSLNNIASFGEDLAGNLYIVTLVSGNVYQLMPDKLAPRNGMAPLGTGDRRGNFYEQDFDAALTTDASAVGIPLPDGWNAVTGVNEMNAIISRSFSDIGDPQLGTYNVGAGDDRALALGVVDGVTTNEIQFTTEVTDLRPVRAIRMLFDLEAWYGASDLAVLGEAAVTARLEHDGRRGIKTLVDFNDGDPIKTSRTLASGPLDGNADINRIAFDSGIIEVDIPAGEQFRVTIDASTEINSSGYTYGIDNFVFRHLGPGDVDGNGQIDPLDLVELLKADQFGKGENSVNWQQGDFNGDDKFGPLDLVEILLHMNNQFPCTCASDVGDPADAVPDVIVDSTTGEIIIDFAGHTSSSIIIDSAAKIFGSTAPSWDTMGEFRTASDSQISNTMFNGTESGIDSLGNLVKGEFLNGVFDFNADLTVKILVATPDGPITVDGHVIVVPEPSTRMLLAFGALALLATKMRRQSRTPGSLGSQPINHGSGA